MRHTRLLLLAGSLTLLMLILASCNSYEKLLKSNDTELQYRTAMELYQKGKYSRSGDLFAKVLPMFQGQPQADSVLYYLGMSYFRDKQYPIAGYAFEQMTEIYPRSPFAEECYFLSAFCNYKSSPEPKLDQDYTHKALAQFQLFNSLYPKSTKRAEVLRYMEELTEKLMRKDFLASQLYYKQELYKAAVVALKKSLETYPLSPYREEMEYLLVKSSYLLAENSILSKQKERYQATVDEALTAMSEFPDSKHYREVLKYYEKALGRLGQKSAQTETQEHVPQ